MSTGLAGGTRYATGSYLTDEVFLYRIVGFSSGAAGYAVELEDCYLLDVVRVPMNVVSGRRLRTVVPSRDGSLPVAAP